MPNPKDDRSREGLIAALDRMKAERAEWVCLGAEMHGHRRLPYDRGRPACPCGATRFLHISEAVRLAEAGQALDRSAA